MPKTGYAPENARSATQPTGLASTEAGAAGYAGLDTWADAQILSAILHGQQRAIAAVGATLPAIAAAAGLAADAISGGGRLVYLASGSPALVSLGDALEIPQTYGVPRNRIVLIFAGGDAIFHNLTGAEEDDGAAAERAVADAALGPADCVLGISASGSTPFTVAGLAAAKAAGAKTVAIASNAGCPLFASGDVQVLLETGAEVIAGSTRMGAGTAQKAALNMISTLMGVRLGHVHDGMMVNVTADNDKLRARAARMIGQIARVDDKAAREALSRTGGAVKTAILVAAGAEGPDGARALLEETGDNLRRALDRLSGR
ncbi:N-acetylmuramic acid 6-phosphate etherase [Arsenicitalea aurantiaca]|nr:N-acetylmuramic acid 6-phosphate etherase [Arsenicitalea aurantiaca]